MLIVDDFSSGYDFKKISTIKHYVLILYFNGIKYI